MKINSNYDSLEDFEYYNDEFDFESLVWIVGKEEAYRLLKLDKDPKSLPNRRASLSR